MSQLGLNRRIRGISIRPALEGVQIAEQLVKWTGVFRQTQLDLSKLVATLHPKIEASSLIPGSSVPLRKGGAVEVSRRNFAAELVPGRERFLLALKDYLAPFAKVETAEFQIVGLTELSTTPTVVHAEIRYAFVGATAPKAGREQRTGTWQTQWEQASDANSGGDAGSGIEYRYR